MIFRLYNDANLVKSVCGQQFKASVSNHNFFNQWLMYDAKMNDRLDKIVKDKILYPHSDIDMQKIHQLQNELINVTIYQKLLRFEAVADEELEQFEQKMDKLGLTEILQKMNEK
ncbi:hypothetical protein IU403_05620 [Aerococcaceae bacterium zg-BR22]|uniref:hypothetical protein n=1 Tax=Aerococcaceae bacterium zg-1292 TaxID=2774330 RepID=UPI004062F855|nr:hypothetical protein [Aerococcaceae bacterium zg-BR22]